MKGELAFFLLVLVVTFVGVALIEKHGKTCNEIIVEALEQGR